MFNNESDSFYRLVAHSFVCKSVLSNVRQKEQKTILSTRIIWLLMTWGAWLMVALMRRLRAVLVWQTLELPLRILQHDSRWLINAISHLFFKTFICFSWSTRKTVAVLSMINRHLVFGWIVHYFLVAILLPKCIVREKVIYLCPSTIFLPDSYRSDQSRKSIFQDSSDKLKIIFFFSSTKTEKLNLLKSYFACG